MIDYWRLARDFKIGDAVQWNYFEPGASSLSPFVGTVFATYPGLGFVDVQFPWGAERISPEELVRVNPTMVQWLPPSLDPANFNTLDVQKAREKTASVNPWGEQSLPPAFYVDLAKLWAKRATDLEAYDNLWHTYHGTDDRLLRSKVNLFYRVASKLQDKRIEQHAHKSAAYWTAQDRQYRVTSEEIGSKKPNCPKCGTQMRRTTYKMNKGARARLFACPKDLFLIKSEAILGPLGEPLGW